MNKNKNDIWLIILSSLFMFFLGMCFYSFVVDDLGINGSIELLISFVSAAATVAAVVVSLWLSRDKGKRYNITGDCFESIIEYGDYDIYQNFMSQENTEEAEKLLFEGTVLFYNPSDYSKSIYNLDVRYLFQNEHGETIDVMTDLNDENSNKIEYISLSAKESKIIKVKQVYEKSEIQNEFNNYNFNVLEIYISSQNEQKEFNKIVLYEYY